MFGFESLKEAFFGGDFPKDDKKNEILDFIKTQLGVNKKTHSFFASFDKHIKIDALKLEEFSKDQGENNQAVKAADFFCKSSLSTNKTVYAFSTGEKLTVVMLRDPSVEDHYNMVLAKFTESNKETTDYMFVNDQGEYYLSEFPGSEEYTPLVSELKAELDF